MSEFKLNEAAEQNFDSNVIVQKRNKMVKLLHKADIKFIISATFVTSPKAKSEKNRPII